MNRTIRPLAFVTLALAVGCSKEQPEPEVAGFVASEEPASVPDRYKPLYRGGLPDEAIDSFRAKLPYDSITLQRTPCYGTCPVYTVTFYRTGKAEFEAKEHLPKLGRFTGEIDPSTYGRLCYLIDDSRFVNMKASYHANWTDDSTCTVAVNAGSRRIEVSDYGHYGPIKLWAIQELIDAVRERIEWKPAK